MRVLSPILRQVVYPTLSRVGYLRSRAVANVLTYHGVLPEGYRVADSFLDSTLITVEAFRSQIKTLRASYNIISPEQFRRWLHGLSDLPERAVLLTCDDGLRNNLTVMAPLLEQEGLQGTFFVTPPSAEDAPQMLWYIELYLMLMECRKSNSALEWLGMHVPAIENGPKGRRSQWLLLMSQLSTLDAPQRAEFLQKAVEWWGLAPDWKKRYLDDPLLRQRFQLLGVKELRQLAGAGMTIGAHTQTHPELSRQPDSLARREIFDCRRELELSTGTAVWALAYPFGNPVVVGDREFRFAREAGYECAFMNVSGALSAADRFALPRVHVTADMNLSTFEAHASGFHQRLQHWLRRSKGPNGRLNG